MLNSFHFRSLVASGLCFVATAASATTYTYEKIAVANATGGATPIALNASGTVLGEWLDANYASHAFTYKAGKITKFDPPGSQNTYPAGINASGEVVGFYANAKSQGVAFTYKSGKFASISLPNKAQSILQVAGVNSKGVWLGSATQDNSQFLFTDTNGTFKTVVAENGPTPVAINDGGSVTGYYEVAGTTQSFVVVGGKLTQISVAGAGSTVPYGMNNANEVVGEDYASNGHQKGFLYKNGKATAFSVPGWVDSSARAINNSGLIVGNVNHADNKTAVYADNNGTFTTLVVPGAKSESAIAVNDAGQILISITNSSYQTEAVLATPKP